MNQVVWCALLLYQLPVLYALEEQGRLAGEPRLTSWPEVLACGGAPEGMSCVPGGAFIRGSDDDTHLCNQAGRPRMKNPDTQPASEVWVQTFFMDQTEVTNAAYRECIAARKCRRSGPAYKDFGGARQPATGVSWFDAVDYCAFRGKHLPTEMEWEKAARGSKGDIYPWGDSPATCEVAVIKDQRGRSCGEKKRHGSNPAPGRVLAVGSRSAGRYGLFDMIGNAEEWVFDWYSSSYAACGLACEGADPKGPCGGIEKCRGHRFRVVRGGSWYWPASHATGIHRRPHYPDNGRKRFHHFGFRCAASVGEAGSIRRDTESK